MDSPARGGKEENEMKIKELLNNIDALHNGLVHIVQPLPGDGYSNLVSLYDTQPIAGDPQEMWDAWRNLKAAIGEALAALNAMHDHYYKEVYNIPTPMTMEAIFGMPPSGAGSGEDA